MNHPERKSFFYLKELKPDTETITVAVKDKGESNLYLNHVRIKMYCVLKLVVFSVIARDILAYQNVILP